MTLLECENEVHVSTFNHIPVMPAEVMQSLAPAKGACVVDGTLGFGGHARLIMDAIGPTGHFIGIDRDAETLALAQERLKPFEGRADFIHGNYCDIDRFLKTLNVTSVDGILLDLGVSSLQLDNPERGFSFRHDGPLDMRMDPANPISAFDIVNSLSEREIATILREYGEERWHNRIARFIVDARARKPINSTKELTDIILKATPGSYRGQGIHPATRSFQAIRIAVNRELESLTIALDKAVAFLKPGGRLCVIAFHSLEDRIVKTKFRTWSHDGVLQLLTKKPVFAGEQEVDQNPRSRSARLRAAERIK